MFLCCFFFLSVVQSGFFLIFPVLQTLHAGVWMCLGDVPGGDRGDSGRDRAISVHPDSGAAL